MTQHQLDLLARWPCTRPGSGLPDWWYCWPRPRSPCGPGSSSARCGARRPTVKQEHQLRTTGPYAITRHPIYTGMLGMLLGSLLLSGGRWVIAFPVYLVLLELKIRVEEKLMLAEFPDEYPRYHQQVPQLIPGLLVIRNRLASG